MLHALHRIPAPGRRVNRVGDLPETNRGVVGAQQPAGQLVLPEDAGVAVVALLEIQGTPTQHVLAAHPVGQRPADSSQAATQRVRQAGDGAQGRRFVVDRVTAEQLVGTLTGQHHLDVLAGLIGDEVQRHQGGIGYRIVQVPDDQRQGPGEFLLGYPAGVVLDADRPRRLLGYVILRIAIHLEGGGKGQQVRVVSLGEGSNGG